MRCDLRHHFQDHLSFVSRSKCPSNARDKTHAYRQGEIVNTVVTRNESESLEVFLDAKLDSKVKVSRQCFSAVRDHLPIVQYDPHHQTVNPAVGHMAAAGTSQVHIRFVPWPWGMQMEDPT